MAQVAVGRPAVPVGGTAGHTPHCEQYRRAYRERNGSLTARVCCCAKVLESPEDFRETPQRKVVVMGDMPCVWCLLWLNTAPEKRPVAILAYPYGATAEHAPEPIEVRGWAHAEELTYGGQYHIRDSITGTYFGLDAKTMAGGDAVCLGHAVGTLRARVPVN